MSKCLMIVECLRTTSMMVMTQTISLAQDFAVLVLERSAKVVLTLLHEYHSIEATVHANNQEFRQRGQSDFVRQALLELRSHRLGTCSALMNVLSQALSAVSPLMAIVTREASADGNYTEGRVAQLSVTSFDLS